MTEPNDNPLSDGTAHVRQNERDETVTTQVATGVAEALGTTPDDIAPIGTVLDAEALNQLFAEGNDADVTVTFDYENCRVTVDADTIRIEPPHHTL